MSIAFSIWTCHDSWKTMERVHRNGKCIERNTFWNEIWGSYSMTWTRKPKSNQGFSFYHEILLVLLSLKWKILGLLLLWHRNQRQKGPENKTFDWILCREWSQVTSVSSLFCFKKPCYLWNNIKIGSDWYQKSGIFHPDSSNYRFTLQEHLNSS